MNYGFLIRNDRCIGCHACSTACKSENDVPLGVNRTWVKNVEKGRYPDVRRHFQVTRCNHCANPPCVRICPVTAMYQRADGIVEFDPQVCIGCKACLQACPYDAIYIDPDTGTAAKCHFCAHRVEMNLEPACVVVCPEHAIISGDLDDPISEISRMLAQHQATVRKPEQGTAPKLFYVDGEDTALHPSATDRAPVSFAWTDVLPLHGGAAPHDARAVDHGNRPRAAAAASTAVSRSGTPLRQGDAQGLPSQGPIHISADRMAGELVRTVYNAQHRIPWHWPVPAYLVTKGAATGLFILLAAAALLGIAPAGPDLMVWGGLLALILIGVTTALLVLDLERPERFFSILTRPQWRSWLTRGAVLLVAFSTLLGVWWLAEVAAMAGWVSTGTAAALRPWAFGLGIPLAIGVAIYTAFLFGQAEGRDLWQSSLLPVHLLVQAVMAGGASLLLLAPAVPLGLPLGRVAVLVFVSFLILDLVVTLGGEFAMPHASADASRAAAEITRGRYRAHFWLGSVGLGHALPLLLLMWGSTAAAALAGALTLVGLYLYEHAFVMAPPGDPQQLMGGRRVAQVLAAAALMAACRAEAPPGADAEAGRAALDAMTATLQDAVVRKDAVALGELFADDAVVLEPDGTVLSGRDAVARAITEMLPRVTSYSLSSQRSESSGDLAYAAQTFQLTLADADSSRGLVGHHLVVARREADGTWRIVRSGSLPGTPPAAHPH